MLHLRRLTPNPSSYPLSSPPSFSIFLHPRSSSSFSRNLRIQFCGSDPLSATAYHQPSPPARSIPPFNVSILDLVQRPSTSRQDPLEDYSVSPAGASAASSALRYYPPVPSPELPYPYPALLLCICSRLQTTSRERLADLVDNHFSFHNPQLFTAERGVPVILEASELTLPSQPTAATPIIHLALCDYQNKYSCPAESLAPPRDLLQTLLPPADAGATSTPAAGSATRKRKASARQDQPSAAPSQPTAPSPPRRSKKQRTTAPSTASSAGSAAGSRRTPRSRPTMSQPGPSSRPSEELKSTTSPPPSRRRSSRNGESSSTEMALPPPDGKQTTKSGQPSDRLAATQSPPPRRHQKKRSAKTNPDVTERDAEEDLEEHEENHETAESPTGDSNDGTNHSAFDDEDLDPFHSSLFGGRGAMGLQSTLRALSGMMSGMSSRLRDILSNLRSKENPSLQLIALQELSDLLLVSNEDNLSGQFSPDPYVKELVSLMQPNQFGEENPEIMLLACRCLANLMEALRGSVANVVYGGAVPILCQKLLDIQFIDLAEQALSTLAKISVDFPASIVREGGLTACLTYLEFFPTSTQRTAVTTAANCCRNLPHDSFPVVRDVMPTLLNVLSSNDPKVVEQGCLCVSRIVESFKFRSENLEELIEPPMLKAVLRLLLPGTTNLIGPHIHTQFLRVLAITAKASPRLSIELLKMDVVDTLYQILTGVSPPEDTDSTAVKMDSVLVMQALIHRPREQVFETLNVICELLPGVPSREASKTDSVLSSYFDNNMSIGLKSSKSKDTSEERLALFEESKPELKRFATILFPTLTDAYSSTVNLHVRQKVLIAQLKMLHILEPAIIEDALRTVPYASFLASILSQKDHASLVSLALRCSELLFQRLEHVYQHQFHREGVISEIVKLSEAPLSADGEKAEEAKKKSANDSNDVEMVDAGNASSSKNDEDSEDDGDDFDEDEDNEDDSDSEDSSVSGRHSLAKMDNALNDLVIRDAQAFLKVYEAGHGATARIEALRILTELQNLAGRIRECYTSQDEDGLALFKSLASYFDGDALESITSSELLNSGIIEVLLEVLGDSQGKKSSAQCLPGLASDNYAAPNIRVARSAFLQAFMGATISEKAQSQSTAVTPFSVLIRKLQDLLSRTEHFEVLTVSHNSLENTRSNATHMLGKQLRLKLVAEDGTEVPRPYRNIMVAIHAIATFKALDDFLQPRIAMSERPRSSRQTRDSILSQISEAARLRDQLAGSHSSLGSSGRNPGGRTGGRSQANQSADEEQGRTASGHRHHRRLHLQQEEDDHDDEPLECADERQLSEEEEDIDDGDEDEELNTIVDDLEDDLEEDPVHDPTAVNMEVASSGKVTARKEDGTRIGTPSQSAPASKPSSSTPSTASSNPLRNPSLATAGRPFQSYAAAMASIPQDWHIEFSVDGKPVSSDTTVYRAVHHNRDNIEETQAKNVWTAIHTVTFRRVPGPPPPEPSTLANSGQEDSCSGDSLEIPSSLSKDATTASILRLLRVLHEMNATIDDILTENRDPVNITPEPLAQFINTKLTAKVNRQLEEPLIVASSCLPNWSEDLARLFSFLFPFETRHLFLQSTAFGYSRAMMRWHNSQSTEDSRRDMRRDDRPFLGRLQRQKVRISRARILDSAMKVMELYGSSPSVLEVEYFEEVGTGLGPTLEFYSTVSKEFSKKKHKIWRETDDVSAAPEYAFGKRGLFPAPMSDEQASNESGKKQLNLFKILGKFVARSMLDSRIIDISFNPAFFRIADTLSSVAPSLGTVKAVDEDLAKSLIMLKQFVKAKKNINKNKSLSDKQKAEAIQNIEVDGVRVDDLSLDFTLPGYPHIELVPNGSDIFLNIDNVDQYIERVIDMTLGVGVRRQVDAFRTGFSQVFPFSSLRAFTPSELVMLFGQAEEDWTIETLMDSIKADHGFNMDSRSVRNLLQTMSELDKQQRRDFLQFVTGSPKLPIGGFKSLTPIFTVVCRPSEPPYTPDDYLPSVMTCVNYLKLPDYSSLDFLKARLSVAIKEGQGAFHLS
ncbi:Ubiquitin-protein ligase Ufd4 [Penicillium argentinense]|uniref:HECT-type E3 ubiquitin transferase n=1 Tax=Penicillium argentinense TaxID=1131581 RepID=A0A9W9EY94_9EURO|nr:Ubiquitin-protein ligase Ufd4 [Penicillium argentinense]KAJ5090070.1 Ubiquitin-protein ligase Ufd4 [Penicillium argentinense]